MSARWHRAALLICCSIILLLARTAPVAADEDFASDQVALVLHEGFSIDELNAQLGTQTIDSFPPANMYLIEIPEGEGEIEISELLRDHPGVVAAEPNYFEETPEGIREMVLSATGGDLGDFLDQDVVQRIGIDAAHGVTLGEGIVVAVLDSGIDPQHPALIGRLHAAGIDFIDDDLDPTETANGIDDDADGLVDEGFGHGTMVAGIVALVAPAAEILAVRVLDDEGRGDAFTVAKAIRYAELHGADVINLSLGGPLEIEFIELQIEILDSSDITIVAGAGNESRIEPPYFPASHGDVVMVTAVDADDVKAPFADYHSDVALSAPGAGIRSAYPGDEWAIGSGCSFATPFVSGEIALMKSLLPDAGSGELRELAENGTVDIEQIPANQPFIGKLGAGRIDVYDAVLAALGSSTGIADNADGDAGGAPIAPALRVDAVPNPTFGAVNLRLPAAMTAGTARIYDTSGRLVRRLSVEGDRFDWDGRGAGGARLPAGLYLVRVNHATAELTARVVLVR